MVQRVQFVLADDEDDLVILGTVQHAGNGLRGDVDGDEGVEQEHEAVLPGRKAEDDEPEEHHGTVCQHDGTAEADVGIFLQQHAYDVRAARRGSVAHDDARAQSDGDGTGYDSQYEVVAQVLLLQIPF